MKKTFILSLLAFFCFAACEDMEDTFDEYAGNGPILYMAKSDTINVASGWERLEVTWKNNLDPKRSGIWVRCQSDNYLKDTLVGPNDTLVNFCGLADATYTITVEKSGLAVSGCTITPWTSGTTGSGDAKM